MKIVFNLLERHILKRNSSSLQVCGGSLKEELLQQKYKRLWDSASYDPFLFYLLHHPLSPPSHLGIYLWRAFDCTEREHRVRRITFSLSPRIKAKFHQLGTAWLSTECLSNFISHLFSSRPSFSGQMGLPIASLLFNPFCHSPTPLHPNPVSSKSSASALCGIDWPYLESSCCFML